MDGGDRDEHSDWKHSSSVRMESWETLRASLEYLAEHQRRNGLNSDRS